MLQTEVIKGSPIALEVQQQSSGNVYNEEDTNPGNNQAKCVLRISTRLPIITS